MPETSPAFQNLRIRLISESAPPKKHQDRPTAFGLKDKKRELHPGLERADGSVQFDVEVQIQVGPEEIRFKGPFVLGTKADPYIGLIWNYTDDDPVTIRGQKIRLDHIPRKTIYAATSGKPGILQAEVIPVTEKTATIPVEWEIISEE
jgi:hypothetical protein